MRKGEDLPLIDFEEQALAMFSRHEPSPSLHAANATFLFHSSLTESVSSMLFKRKDYPSVGFTVTSSSRRGSSKSPLESTYNFLCVVISMHGVRD